MCHQGVVDRCLRVTRLSLLPSLHLGLGARFCGRRCCCRILLVVLQGWDGPLFWGRVVQDRCHTQLHLEVQKVIPGVLKEQILEVGSGGGEEGLMGYRVSA